MLKPISFLGGGGGAVSPFAAYAANSVTPELVADFANATPFFGFDSAASDFETMFTTGTTGLATTMDSDGNLKWNAHNLIKQSDGSNVGVNTEATSVATLDGTTPSGRDAHKISSSGGGDGSMRAFLNVQDPGEGGFLSSQRLLKAGPGITTISMNIAYMTSGNAAVFDLTDGTIVSNDNGLATIVDNGNGWYLCSIVAERGTNTVSQKRVFFDTVYSVATDGSEYFWQGDLRCFRSNLGGMVDNPDTGTSLVLTAGAAVYLPRRDAYYGPTPTKGGLRFESAAATNLLLNTATLSTQNVTTTNVNHTLHFTGTGTVTLTGTSTAGPLVGTGTAESDRVSLTFTPTAGTLTLTVSGTVSAAQLEVGDVPSSYIPNAGSTTTRALETLSIAGANTPANTTAMSIAMKGLVSYADVDASNTVIPYLWSTSTTLASSATDLRGTALRIQTTNTQTGRPVFLSHDGNGGIISIPGSETQYTPGVNVAFNVASRVGSTFLNGAAEGTALTQDTTTSLVDLTATAVRFGHINGAATYNGFISEFTIWGADIGDTGIEEAST